MVVATGIGWGLVTNTNASWLTWQGYLLGPIHLGGKTGGWAFANLGVLGRAIGFVAYLVFGRADVRAGGLMTAKLTFKICCEMSSGVGTSPRWGHQAPDSDRRFGMDSMAAAPAEHKSDQVQVVVNRKRVVLTGKEATGEEIKQAAIAQGDTTVQPDSRLFRREDESWVFVPDNETIKVHDGERFRAQGNQEDS